jgi:hypothetical protein
MPGVDSERKITVKTPSSVDGNEENKEKETTANELTEINKEGDQQNKKENRRNNTSQIR